MAEVGVTPHVLIANIQSAGEPDMPVHNDGLAVIAVVDLKPLVRPAR